MAITFNDNLFVSAPKAIDTRFGPFTSTGEANSTILEVYRYVGLTVLIGGPSPVEYWYFGGTGNDNLVLKTTNSLTTIITGGTYNDSTGVLSLDTHTGGTVTISNFFTDSDDKYVTGFTFNTGNYNLTIGRNGGLSDLTQSLSILATDMTVTGGTYNSSNGVVTLTNNSGGTFNISGFTTNYTNDTITGGTYSIGSTFSGGSIQFRSTLPANNFNVTGLTNTFVTGGTYSVGSSFSGNSIQFRNNSGSTFDVAGIRNTFVTGGTYSVGSSFSGNSIDFRNNSGSTFTVSGLRDTVVTGGSYSIGSTFSGNSIQFINNSGGTFTVSGLRDIFVTGGSYNIGSTFSGNSIQFINNSGGTFTIGGLRDIVVTGGTYNSATSTIRFTNNSGGTFDVVNISAGGSGGPQITGGTYVVGSSFSGNSIQLVNSSGDTVTVTSIRDTFVTGGSYVKSASTVTFLNNSGSTFAVTGITDTFVTAATYTRSSGSIQFQTNNSNAGGFNVTGLRDYYVTGGTYSTGNTFSGNSIQFRNTSDETFSVSGIQNTFITGGTYSSSNVFSGNSIQFRNNSGSTFNVAGVRDTYITAFTFNTGSYDIAISDNSGNTITRSLSVLASDIQITGGTYSSSTGVITFENSSGGTFSVSGFAENYTNDTITGGTYSIGSTFSGGSIQFRSTLPANNFSVTGLTNTFVTGGTYSTGTTFNGNSIQFRNNSGSTFDVAGIRNTFVTGGTYNRSSGSITFRNNANNTFNVIDILDTVVTGGTYSTGTTFNGNSIQFTNNSGNTFSVSGITDKFITGGTYNNDNTTLTFRRNDNQTFNVGGVNGIYVSAFTFTPSTNVLTIGRYTAVSLPVDLSVLDQYITAGTYTNLGIASSANSITLTYNEGNGSFSVSGVQNTFVTGGTYSAGTAFSGNSIQFRNNSGGTFSVAGVRDTVVTGGTYNVGSAFSGNSIQFINNSGGTFSVAGVRDTVVTGGTYNVGSTFSGNSIQFANNSGGTFTVSGLRDTVVTGGTYNVGSAFSGNSIQFVNNSGGTFTVSGLRDTVVTGGTYSSGAGFNGNSIQFLNNSGGAFNISGVRNTFLTAFTFDIGSYDMSLTDNSGGVFTRNLSILASDVTVTGGTYNPEDGVVTFSSNTTNTRTGLFYAGNWTIISGYTAGTVVTYTVNGLDYYAIADMGPGNGNPSVFNRWRLLSLRGVFGVTGFTVGYTNIYTSAATYSQTSGEIILTSTDPSKTLTITSVTSIYGKDDSIKSNRVVNLNQKTLNFSSSTASNLLTISTGGTVGIGVLSGTTKLHVSAANDPIRLEGVAASSDSNVLTIDDTGVVHSISVATLYSNINTLYNSNGSLNSNRIVNLSGRTLNFSSSTNPNTLVMSGGNVGIGTATPITGLHLKDKIITIDGADPTSGIKFTYSNGANHLIAVDSSDLAFYTTSQTPNDLRRTIQINNGFSTVNTVPFLNLRENISQIPIWVINPNTATTSVYTGLLNLRVANPGGFIQSYNLAAYDAADTLVSYIKPNGDGYYLGRVGIGTTAATNALHVSATTNPVKIEGLIAQSATTKLVATNASNELVNFSGANRSIPYFTTNGVISHSPTFTYSDGSTRNLQIDDGELARGSQITLGGGRGNIITPSSVSSGLIFQAGTSNPFDQTKFITLRNGATNYVSFTTSGVIGGNSAHTATFTSTVSINNVSVTAPNWGLSGIATRVLANNYTDSTLAITANETVASSFAIPTFTALTGKTYSALTNVYIAGAPIAGTNVTGLISYALKVNAGTTYFGGDVTLSGISSGSTAQVLTRETNGNVAFRTINDMAVSGRPNSTLFWYDEPNTQPSVAPLASGAGSIAIGDGAEALGSNMFVAGNNAGSGATAVFDVTFIGGNAGYGATGDTSNFIGAQAGLQAGDITGSNFIGFQAGYQSKHQRGAFLDHLSNFIGYQAGYKDGFSGGDSSYQSNFIGYRAGSESNNSNRSNFIGAAAGLGADNSFLSNFIGSGAGNLANGSNNSNFIGPGAGNGSSNAFQSNFIGNNAGNTSSNASDSNFIGFEAGQSANNSSRSNFIGYRTGYLASAATYSNFIGYHVGENLDNTQNNIIIGTGISLSANSNNSINIGGIIFGSNAVNNTNIGITITAASATGKIGIGKVNPEYTLDVSGDTNVSGNLRALSQLIVATGTSKAMGFVTLAGGTDLFIVIPSFALISNSLISSSSMIILSPENPNGTIKITAKGTGTCNISSNSPSDNGTIVRYLIINPA
jgi:hypothetical protein